MQTDPLAGNRRASIRFKSGASNSHANTRSKGGGARVHDSSKGNVFIRLVDGSLNATVNTNGKFNESSSIETMLRFECTRVQRFEDLTMGRCLFISNNSPIGKNSRCV